MDKVYNDPIHGSIQMPEYCQIIIDTPEFQRLRFIKQLGCTCYVFPSAVHTRFEHSIGVSYLAGKLASNLRQNDSKSIQEVEVACVEIAGLCHDLGHGPFSHAFEEILQEDKKGMQEDKEGVQEDKEGVQEDKEGVQEDKEGVQEDKEGVQEDKEGVQEDKKGVQEDKDGTKWNHEKQSVILLKYLIEHNSLKEELEKHDICENEIEIICQLILGVKKDEKMLLENKFYLYQIVNNSLNGVDVDRWDYLARDTLYLGMKSAFVFNRILPFVKVLDVQRGDKTRRELCFRDKVASDLNQMFLARRRLHYTSYQHRVSKVISIMLKDAFREAADHLIFVGEGGKEYSLLETVKDPTAFCQANDTIMNEIMRSRSREPEMVKARAIIDRIHKRNCYQCIGEIEHANEKMLEVDPVEIKKLVVIETQSLSSSSLREIFHADNIEVEVSRFDYGSGYRNPLLDIPFYKKSSDGKFDAELLPEDKLPADLPQRMQDDSFRIYTRVPNLEREAIEDARDECKNVLKKICGKSRSAENTPVMPPTMNPTRTPCPPMCSFSITSSSSHSGSNVSNDGDAGFRTEVEPS